jgi:plasmid stabilization system protein ParE
MFPFDSAERFVWDYRPGTRQGLSLAEMTAPQQDAALAILSAALSERGAAEVRAIIALEPILGDIERQAGRSNWIRRDPDLYWFAIFGEPGDRSSWAWRIGGHHVAVQSTVADGRVIGSAPSFLGANPATVPTGPFAGRRAIDAEEALARTLLGSMSPAQRRLAIVDPVAPPDILSGNGRRAGVRDVPSGIRHDQLEAAQRDGLEGLVRHYLDRSDADVAEAEWDRIRAAGLAPLTFAWAGSDLPGRGHYYAIRGPSLLIEYDNTQDGANHIHAVWRDLTNDWGEDLLAAHYRAGHRVA